MRGRGVVRGNHQDPAHRPARLEPHEIYPASDPEIGVRSLRLRSGLRVRAVETGPPSGDAVLLLPGWGSSVYEYRKNLPALAGAGYRAITVDLKGHGLSDKPSDPRQYSLDAMVDHVLEVMDALELRRAHLIGHSLGGAIAAELALRATTRVRSLALIAPVGYHRIWAATLATWLSPAVLSPLLDRPTPQWMVRAAVRLARGPRSRPSPRDIEEYWATACTPGFLLAMRHLVHGIDWSPARDGRLCRLAVPLLVIFGRQDRVISPRALNRYRRDVPTVQTVLLEMTGHLANEEAPEEVNQALIGFLARSDRPDNVLD